MADTTDGFSGGFSGWDDDWDEDNFATAPETKSEKAQRFFDELESDEELLREFNLLLRKKKLEQLNK